MAESAREAKMMRVPEAPLPASGSHLEDYLRDVEGFEKVPKIKLHLFFGDHETEADARRLFQSLVDNKSKVLLVEDSASSRKSLIKLKGALEGDTLLGSDITTFYDSLISQLREARYQIIFGCADVPDNYSLSINSENARNKLGRFVRDIPRLKLVLEDALVEINALFSALTRADREREQYWLITLGPEVARLLRENPELANLDLLDVTAFWGAGHSHLAKVVKSAHAATRETLDLDPSATLASNELFSAQVQDETFTPTHDQLVQLLFEATVSVHYLRGNLYLRELEPRDIYKYRVLISNAVSQGEKEEYYARVSQQMTMGTDYPTKYLEGILERSGIPKVSEGASVVAEFLMSRGSLK